MPYTQPHNPDAPSPPADGGDISAIALSRAESLIEQAVHGEFDVHAELHYLLQELGYEPRSKKRTDSGEADIYVPGHRVVFEAKDRGEVDPDARGSQEDETQLEQLTRYIRDLVKAERSALEGANGRLGDQLGANWTGLLTDGQLYLVYRFDGRDGGLLSTAPETRRSFVGASPRQLVGWLRHWLGAALPRLELPDSTAALAQIFRGHEPGLADLHRSLRRRPGTTTKHDLWLRMIRGSGFDVDESDDDLFRSHTLLVHGAEAVIASLNRDDRPGVEIMADSFATWPQNRGLDGAPTSIEGVEWTNALFDSVRDYDWRSRGRDVLRDVYQSLIPQRHRKAFGEYYTPDWLAGLVVQEVLDDDWCARAIAAAQESIEARRPLEGIGVLDPACGSGTFLYQSARRLLESDAMRLAHLDADMQAQVALALVNGIDVHPIAVAIARATLLRALPPGATVNADAVNVYQADSLGIERAGGMRVVEANGVATHLEAESPAGTVIPIPLGLANRPDVGRRIKRVVDSAHAGDPLPPGVALGLDEDDASLLGDMQQALTSVCAEEGNSVWAWWLNNWLSARSLRQRGIDRIVANPPWVVMKDIQVETRKRELEGLIGDLGLSAGGKNASSFDIAGLFVSRCRDLYLSGDAAAAAAGWVLNRAALKSQTWQNVRDDQADTPSEHWDLWELRPEPFYGASSCVWIQRGDWTEPRATWVLRNIAGAEQLHPSDDPSAMRSKTRWVGALADFPQRPSAYADGFRNGVRFAPQCLVVVEDEKPSTKPSQIRATLGRSRHAPWSDLPQQTVEVLQDRVFDAVTANHDLLAFGLALQRTRVLVVPPESTGEPDAPALRHLDALYRDHAGKGINTPRTLRGRIDYGKALTRQLAAEPSKGLAKVAYNASGRRLRAARISGDDLLDDGCCWMLTSSEEEAAYLTTLFNAPCLQLAYRQARTSDRHNNRNPVMKVPFPAFDPTDDLHQRIAALCRDAEAAAKRAIDILDIEMDQQRASSHIRQQLIDNGIDAEIDDAVRQLMPNHTVHEYDPESGSTCHPWKHTWR